MGSFYAEIPTVRKGDKNDAESNQEAIDESTTLIDPDSKKFVQHVLFPALKFILVPPREFATDGSFCKLALLSKLYKVFERC